MEGKTYLFHLVNIMAADDQVMHGARASATKIFYLITGSPRVKG